MALIDVFYIEGYLESECYGIYMVNAKTKVPFIGEIFLRGDRIMKGRSSQPGQAPYDPVKKKKRKKDN